MTDDTTWECYPYDEWKHHPSVGWYNPDDDPAGATEEALLEEIKDLRRWKVNAMTVFAQWDAAYGAINVSAADLGASKPSVVKAEIENLRQDVQFWTDETRKFKESSRHNCDEVNRLRALIVEWIEAHDKYAGPRSDEAYLRFDDASMALRNEAERAQAESRLPPLRGTQ